jgi:hypothetical protein
MMRWILLLIAVVFLLGLSCLTIYDVAHDGVTPLSVMALVIIGFFAITLVGALTARATAENPYDLRPPEDGPFPL